MVIERIHCLLWVIFAEVFSNAGWGILVEHHKLSNLKPQFFSPLKGGKLLCAAHPTTSLYQILWFLSSVKYLNAYTGVVLFCCRKDFYRLLWSSLPFITHLENRSQHCPCSLNTLHVGGKLSLVRVCILTGHFKKKSSLVQFLKGNNLIYW